MVKKKLVIKRKKKVGDEGLPTNIPMDDMLSDDILFAPQTMSISKHNKAYIWLVSLTDVIALILAFFVLLYSMKEPAQEHLSKVGQSLKGETGEYQSAENSSDLIKTMKIEVPKKVISLNYLEALLRRYSDTGKLMPYSKLERFSEFLVVSWPQERLLRDIKNQENALQELSLALVRLDNYIEVAQLSKNKNSLQSGFDGARQLVQILKSSGYNRDILLSSQIFDSSEIKTDRLYLVIYNREEK